MIYVPVSRIQAEVAKSFKIDVATMAASSRISEGKTGQNCREVSHPRQVAMYLAKELTYHSKTRIGHLFGRRDHTTVIHAIREVEKRLAKDRNLRRRVARLKKVLQAVDNHAPFALLLNGTDSSDCLMDNKPKAIPAHALNWREKEAAEEARLRDAYHSLMKTVAFEPKVREEARVRRDPCVRCGARGDVGCVHTRVAA